MTTLYTMRLALTSPDVTWDRKGNPEPWQKYAEKQYKVDLTYRFYIYTRLHICTDIYFIIAVLLSNYGIQAQSCSKILK